MTRRTPRRRRLSGGPRPQSTRAGTNHDQPHAAGRARPHPDVTAPNVTTHVEEVDEGILGDDPADAYEEIERAFPNVYVFVTDYLATLYTRPVDDQSPWRWRSQWWKHPEAVGRLEGVWLAFETLRLDDGTGISTWWRDHLDPAMAALSDQRGPFAQCSNHDTGCPLRCPAKKCPQPC